MSAPIIVGHRGAKGEAPENTLDGFRHARQLGLTEIELDVRLSRDEKLIVLHDYSLHRTTGLSKKCGQLTASELSQLNATRPFPDWPTATGVPTLAAVIKAGGYAMRYQLEVKANSPRDLEKARQQLVRFIDEHQLKERVIVTSTHLDMLAVLHADRPDIGLGYVCKHRHKNPVEQVLALEARWLILHTGLITPDIAQKAQRHNLYLSTWTINDLALADTLVERGVTSLITDYPSRFLAHFKAS